MNRDAVQNEIARILSDNEDESLIIDQLEKLIQKNGPDTILQWRNPNNKKKNTIMHELVEKDCPQVIEHLLNNYKLDCNVHREFDGKTPAELAKDKNNEAIIDLLDKAEQNAINQETPDDEDSDGSTKNRMNIVWIDLEMTSIEEPKIMECAVIITNKYLHEIQRDQWVVHCDQKEIDSLGEWHHNQFKDISKGGNGLFQECLKSTLTEEQVESKLLALIQRHCPEKECPLAGSSIHTDKEVLKKRMPKVNDYLHYRIIDVSSFRGILKRWAPKKESKFVSELSNSGQDTVNHRAMNDIEYSIELMKLFFPMLTGRQYRNKRLEDKSSNNNRRHNVGEASAVPKGNNRFVGNFEEESSMSFADEKSLEERLKLNKSIDIKALNLNPTCEAIYRRNPHLREIFIDDCTRMETVKAFKSEHRLLNLNNRNSNDKLNMTRNITTEHWEVRKLLLIDIEFLTKYAQTGKYLVIYIGAAPGIHINYLSELFPNLDFVLIDKKKVETKKTSTIHIRAGNLIDEIVKEYSKSRKNILLICNVYKFGAKDNSEDNFVDDMDNQKDWHLAMKPVASLLTFHIPPKMSKVKYFTGEIIFEPWTSRYARSCRMVVLKDARPIEYDVGKLKSAMSHFHNVVRRMYYEHDLADSNSDGLDHCYDCRSEIWILSQYLEKIQRVSGANLSVAVSKMSETTSKVIYDQNRQSIVDGIRTLAVVPKI